MSKDQQDCVSAFMKKAGMTAMEAELTVASSANPWETLKRAKKCRTI